MTRSGRRITRSGTRVLLTLVATGALVPPVASGALAAGASAPHLLSRAAVSDEASKARILMPRRPPTAEDRLMAAQWPLDKAADRITAAAQRSGHAGYTSLAVEVATNSVHLRWKGALPSKLLPLLASIRGGGIGVTVSPARYSLKELQARTRAIIVDEKRRDVPNRYRAVTLLPLTDGSGIEAIVPQRDAFTERARSRFAVVRTTSTAGAPVPLTRQADIPAFYGGARLQLLSAPDGAFQECTSGFGVARDGVTAFLLSAAHCGSAPNSVNNGVGVPIGSVAGTVRSFEGSDTMLINVSASGSSVYDGPWDNPTNSTDTVIGSTNNYVNDQVCTSGSFSGVRCGIVVTNPNATVDLEGYFITEVYAQRTDGTTAAGQGDSGGPVYAQTSNPYEIVAKGIISAGDGASPVPCAGDASNGRECFSSIYWISINNALSDFGATLNTG